MEDKKQNKQGKAKEKEQWASITFGDINLEGTVDMEELMSWVATLINDESMKAYLKKCELEKQKEKLAPSYVD